MNKDLYSKHRCEKIQEIRNLIKNNEGLSFLNKSINIIDKLLYQIQVSPEFDPIIPGSFENENAVYVDGSMHYMNDKSWDNLFQAFLITSQPLTKVEDKNTIKSSFSPLAPNYLEQMLQNIFQSIYSSKGQTNVKLTLNGLMQGHAAQATVKMFISNCIKLSNHKKNKMGGWAGAHNNAYFIKYNDFVQPLGNQLLSMFCQQHPILSDYMGFFLNYKSTLSITNLPKMEFFINYLKAIFSGDIIQQRNFLSMDSLKNKFDTKNDLIVQLISSYILANILRAYNKHNIPFPQVKDLLDNSFSKNNLSERYKHELFVAQTLAKVMYLFVTECQVGYGANFPALFHLDKIYKSNHTRLVIFVNNCLVSELLQSSTNNKPFFTESNMSVLNAINASVDVSLAKMYENKSSFVHENPDISCYINKDSFLEKHKPREKFTIDVDCLLFNLTQIAGV